MLALLRMIQQIFCVVLLLSLINAAKSRGIIFSHENSTLARLSTEGEFQAVSFRGSGAPLDLSSHPTILQLQQSISNALSYINPLLDRLESVTMELNATKQNVTVLESRIEVLESRLVALESKISSSIPLSNRALYTSGSPSFAVPSNVSILVIEAYGGGGGGTTGTCYNSGYTCYNGAGGGGGGYAEKTLVNIPAGTLISMTIGAGGGYSATGMQTTVSVSGGRASLLATGGGGACCFTTAGTGGTASGGDINISGYPGSVFGPPGYAAGRLGGVYGNGGAGLFASNGGLAGAPGAVVILY